MLDIMAGSRNDFRRNRSKILTLFIEDRELFVDIHIYNSVSLIKSQCQIIYHNDAVKKK